MEAEDEFYHCVESKEGNTSKGVEENKADE